MTHPHTAAQAPYLSLKTYYEATLAAHGPTHLGVDWADEASMQTRFHVMASAIPANVFRDGARPHILDVGCGPGLFLDYLNQRFGPDGFTYTGIDISPAMISAARARHPGHCFRSQDLLSLALPDDCFDFAVLNGVFTVRHEMSEADALDFATELLSAVFPACALGLAANFMAPHADWRDEKLFYLPYAQAADMLKENLSRHFSFRSDYGLWEYTARVLKAPTAPSIAAASCSL